MVATKPPSNTNKDNASTKAKPSPPSVLAVRTKADITFIEFPRIADQSTKISGDRIPNIVIPTPTSDLIWTTRGDRCAVPTAQGICVYDVDITPGVAFNLTLLAKIPHKTSRWLQFSPRGTYLVSFETQTSECRENFSVWNLAAFATATPQDLTNERFGLLFRRGQQEDVSIMPHSIIQWTDDEQYAFFLTQRGSLDCFLSTDLTSSLTTLNQRGAVTFAISPVIDKLTQGTSTIPVNAYTNQHIALFSPTLGTTPGATTIFSVKDIIESVQSNTPNVQNIAPSQTMSLFRASEAHIKWHQTAKACLVLTSFDDPSVDSYYPETRLYIMYPNAPAQAITFDGEHNVNIYEAQWSPAGFEFATLHGKSHDAHLTLWYAKDCSVVSRVIHGAWNQIHYAPSGRLILVAGVGALSGHFEVWDKQTNTTLVRSQDRDSPRIFGWSACGQFFFSATIFPFLRVDNQFKIFTFQGNKLLKEVGTVPAIDKQINPGSEVSIISQQQQGPTQGHFCQVAAHIYPRVGLMPDHKITNEVLKAAQDRLDEEKRQKATRPARGTLDDFAGETKVAFQKKKVDNSAFGNWRS